MSNNAITFSLASCDVKAKPKPLSLEALFEQEREAFINSILSDGKTTVGYTESAPTSFELTASEVMTAIKRR